MLRGVLSILSTRITNSLYLMSPKITNGGLGSVAKPLMNQQVVNFTSGLPLVRNTTQYLIPNISKGPNSKLLVPHKVLSEQVRTLIKFSLKKGRRKSVAAVRRRFFRLHWGAWIRPIAGRHKKLWKKSAKKRNHLLNHVFCNATQSRMLDKMVNKFWRKPKYYIEDPYEPYHKRENFSITRLKPWRPEGVDYE